MKLARPRIRTANPSIAKIPEKTADLFYSSVQWRVLRAACLRRDDHVCQVCFGANGLKATIADHILSRRRGGLDELSNLRSLCRTCDNGYKEDHLGDRRRPL